jgi:ankyrin repeat protein
MEPLLHLALTKWHLAVVNEIKHVVQHGPGIVTVPDAQGNWALHLAARQFHIEVVECLVEQRPGVSVRTRGHKGRLPIHLVADPTHEGLAGVDHEGRLPLHDAPNWEDEEEMRPGKLDEVKSVVQLLVERPSEALRAADQQGNLPLHVAARREVPDSVLRLLVSPPRCEELRAANLDGWLPD